MRPLRSALVAAVGGIVLLVAYVSGAVSTASPDLAARIQPNPRPVGSPSALASPQPTRGVQAVAAASSTARANVVGSDIIAVTSSKEPKVALVDPVAGKVVQSVDVGGPMKSLILTPDGRTAWAFSSKPGQNEIAVVDLVKGQRRDTKRLHDGPAAAAFSSDGRRAYVALGGGTESPPSPNSILFINTSNGDEFGHVELGTQTSGVQLRRGLVSLAVTPGPNGDVLYAAGHASGTIWALDGGSGKLLAELPVGGGPFLLLPDVDRQRLYVLIDTLNRVVAIDTMTTEIVGAIDLPSAPSGAALGPDGTLFVTAGAADELWTIAPGAASVTTRIAVGKQPSDVALSADGSRAYVTNRAAATLTIVDTQLGTILATLPVSAEPSSVLAIPRPSPDATPRPLATNAPNPTPTPSVVPTATPLPEGAKPPEHMLSGAVSETFLGDANAPVAMAFAPDGRLFYNELKTGKIRVVDNGRLLPDPFYAFGVAGQPETGLLGLALDPDFADNHFVYVFYTSVPDGGTQSGGSNGPNQVVRLTDVASKGTQLTPILKDLPSGPIHNSGTIRFGPDGKLYVALGDTDQGSSAQDLHAITGKILRVNPDGSIPADNPFVDQPGQQGAIWAYGLRNAFSFDFHPINHNLLATENGPGDNDELDLIVRGSNYGWPPTGYKGKPGVVDPLAVMNPPIAPTGMAFYTGDQFPEWKNDWFYCNYHQGQLRRVRLAPGSFDRIVFEEVVKQGCTFAVATGPDGALYYSDVKGIYRIYAAGATLLPAVATQPAESSAATPAEALPASTRVEDRDLNISLSEWKMAPSRTTLPAGTIRFLAENIGATVHALRVVGEGLDLSTDDFKPGESRTVSVVLRAGTYQLICPVPGHQNQGMVNTISVVGP